MYLSCLSLPLSRACVPHVPCLGSKNSTFTGCHPTTYRLTRRPGESSKKHAVDLFPHSFWVSHQALCLGSHCRSSHCQAMSSPRFTPLWERRTLAHANGFGCTCQAPLRNLSAHRQAWGAMLERARQTARSLIRVCHMAHQNPVVCHIFFPLTWLFGRIPVHPIFRALHNLQ